MAYMYAYLRLPLVGGRRNEILQEMTDFAARHGFGVRRVFCEAGPPAGVLWSLVREWDRRSGGHLVSELTEFAHREGVDLDRLLAGGPSPNSALRALFAELDGSGGYVVVPSPEHLDGLDVPRSVLLRRISEIRPPASVLYLRPESGGLRPANRPDLRTRATRGKEDPGVVGEFKVNAFGLAVEVARLNTHVYLSRAGLGELIEQADALVSEFVRDAISAAETSGAANELRVRLVRRPETLAVEFDETREHADEPVSEAMLAHCARVNRSRSVANGTVTWCELPLPRVSPDSGGVAELAQAIRDYQSWMSRIADVESR
ncbi:hypothetical protein AB4305_28225 [Nocardia sp. 2YAB30]|uniref:hypothetical protein n=1 Tax=Nocardia sp. 2YAB30 TaxID=3233022 RepID=UPI003F9C47A8